MTFEVMYSHHLSYDVCHVTFMWHMIFISLKLTFIWYMMPYFDLQVLYLIYDNLQMANFDLVFGIMVTFMLSFHVLWWSSDDLQIQSWPQILMDYCSLTFTIIFWSGPWLLLDYLILTSHHELLHNYCRLTLKINSWPWLLLDYPTYHWQLYYHLDFYWSILARQWQSYYTYYGLSYYWTTLRWFWTSHDDHG